MTKLNEGGVYSGKTSTSQNFFAGNLMLTLNSKYTEETSLVEGINFNFLHS